jgi:hypothetical protein
VTARLACLGIFKSREPPFHRAWDLHQHVSWNINNWHLIICGSILSYSMQSYLHNDLDQDEEIGEEGADPPYWPSLVFVYHKYTHRLDSLSILPLRYFPSAGCRLSDCAMHGPHIHSCLIIYRIGMPGQGQCDCSDPTGFRRSRYWVVCFAWPWGNAILLYCRLRATCDSCTFCFQLYSSSTAWLMGDLTQEKLERIPCDFVCLYFVIYWWNKLVDLIIVWLS